MPLDVTVIGTEPKLEGLHCEGLVCESFVAQGKIEADANVAYISAGGHWHRLVIDAGVVFWKIAGREPTAWEVPEEGWSYPLRDVGEEFNLIGQKIASVEVRDQNGAVEVLIRFCNGMVFTLRNVNDASSFSVA